VRVSGAGRARPRRWANRANAGAGAVSAAPDYVEPIVGWRTWLVVQEGEGFRLRSVVYDAFWPARKELVARCLRRSRALLLPWRRRAEHVPPADGCGCGIYATGEPEEAASYLEERSWEDALSVQRVIGTVSLWGRVIECRRGWRASHAYPQAIYVPATRDRKPRRVESRQDVALALTDYGVPVELLDADARRPAQVAAALRAEAARGLRPTG
jgi:hypothetical protein